MPVLIQRNRTAAVTGGDPRRLETALAMASRTGDVPATAQLQVELGQLRGDADLIKTGRPSLEHLGDERQLERYRF